MGARIFLYLSTIKLNRFLIPMKSAFAFLLLSTGLTAHSAIAQTRTATKPTSTPKTTTKEARATRTGATAKPAPTRTTTTKPVTKPAAKPAVTQPASTPTPNTPPESAPIKFEIPGVAAQQAPSFSKGSIGVNLGLGLGNGYGYGYALGGSTHSSPAISLSVEKGVVEGIGPGVISVGGLIGYKSESYKWNDRLGKDYKATWNNIYIAARGAYHYNFTDNPKVDTYAGVSLAALVLKYSDNYTDSSIGDYDNTTSLDVGVFLGGRYLLTDKLGAFAELGYDMSYLKLGLTTKF
jgi:hypothetical protein